MNYFDVMMEIIAFTMPIVGLVFVIIGFVKKDKESEENQDNEEDKDEEKL